jgi:hypothetical protein
LLRGKEKERKRKRKREREREREQKEEAQGKMMVRRRYQPRSLDWRDEREEHTRKSGEQ